MLEARGGSDKGADGHRRDTIPICNGLIRQGYAAQALFYSDTQYDQVQSICEKVDGIIVRINPGKYEGVTNSKYEKLIKDCVAKGVVAMSHPDVMR